jgi:hypothetical protein
MYAADIFEELEGRSQDGAFILKGEAKRVNADANAEL